MITKFKELLRPISKLGQYPNFRPRESPDYLRERHEDSSLVRFQVRFSTAEDGGGLREVSKNRLRQWVCKAPLPLIYPGASLRAP